MNPPSSLAALIRVLVVDSRAIVLRGLSEVISGGRPLTEAVGTASSYGQALELVERLRPEVVVMSLFDDLKDAFEAVSVMTRRFGARVQILRENPDTPVDKCIELGAVSAFPLDASGEVIVREIIRASHLAKDPTAVWLGALSRLPLQIRPGLEKQPKEQVPLSELTSRERDVVRAIMSNPSAKYITIGSMLGVGEHTVHNHLTSIYQKLNLTNRIELLVYVSKHQGGALEAH